MKQLFFALTFLGAMTVLGCQQQDSTPITQPPGGVGSGGSMQTSQEEDALKGILKNDPDNLNTLIRLGNLYMDSQRFSDAVEYYERALKINPDDNNVRVDMGTCYRRSGRPDLAEKTYREALKIDPNHAFANMNLGIVLAYDLGRNAEAIKYFEKYVQLDPASPNAPQIKAEIERLRAQTAAEAPK
jgi:tetratricopeptide (TPR) repeat protein